MHKTITFVQNLSKDLIKENDIQNRSDLTIKR